MGMLDLIFKPLLHEVSLGNGILIFSLIMARLIIIINLVPFLGGNNAPGPAKMGIAIMLSCVVWPFVSQGVTHPELLTPTVYFGLLLKELFVGFVIGFVASEIFYMTEIAGQLIDVVRGANQVQLMVPELKQRSSAFGTLNYQLTLVVFLAARLHVLFFEALMHSFSVVPVASMPKFSFGFEKLADAIMHMGSQIFMIGVTMAMPVAVVCLIIDISFGLINRVAPQMNAYFLALPAKGIGGMVVFFVGFSYVLEQYQFYSGTLINALRQVIALLG